MGTLKTRYIAVATVLSLAGSARAAEPSSDDVAGKSRSLVLSGVTAPSRRADLAFPTAGVLAKISVDVGDSIASGAPVAEIVADLERSLAEKSRIAAESADALRVAEIEAKIKAEELAWMEELARRNACAPHELTQARFAHTLALARIAQERTHLELRAEEHRAAQAALRQRQIAAPFAGVIAERLHEPGEAVDPLKPVVVLVRLDPLWVELDVPAECAGRLAVGDHATVRQGGEQRSAAVCQIEPLVDIGSMTFRVRLSVPNANRRWVAGVPVEVALQVGAVRRAASARLE